MAGEEPKWHHYVPKCHLRHWQRIDIRAPEVFIAYKKNRKYYSNIVSDIFRGRHLYSLVGAERPDPVLERTVFSGIDGRAARVVRMLDFIENFQLTLDEDQILAQFVLASIFRTPWDIDFIKREIAPKLVKAAKEHDGIDLSPLPFVTEECRERFLKNDSDYIAANGAIVGICNHIVNSEQSRELARWPRFVYRLRHREFSFITGDQIRLGLRARRKKVINIVPLTRKTCLISAEEPEFLLDFTRDEERMCYAVNKGLWERARYAVVGDPTAPFLNELGLVRGDPGRP